MWLANGNSWSSASLCPFSITITRSKRESKSALTTCERWPSTFAPNLAAARSVSGGTGWPGRVQVPALSTTQSLWPLAISRARKKAAASGERYRLPVQTKSTLASNHSSRRTRGTSNQLTKVVHVSSKSLNFRRDSCVGAQLQGQLIQGHCFSRGLVCRKGGNSPRIGSADGDDNNPVRPERDVQGEIHRQDRFQVRLIFRDELIEVIPTVTR